MLLFRNVGIGLLIVALVGVNGCGVQDPTQPPVGSISVGARKDNAFPNVPAGKTKSSATNSK